MNSGKSGGYISSDLDIEKLIKKGMDLNVQNTQNAEEQNNAILEKTDEDKLEFDDKIKENPNLQQLFGIKIDDLNKDESVEKVQADETVNIDKNINDNTSDNNQEKEKNNIQEISSNDKNIQGQENNSISNPNQENKQQEKKQDLISAQEQSLSIQSEDEQINKKDIDNIQDIDKNIPEDKQSIENTIVDIEKKAEPVKSLSQLIEKGQNILNLSPEERKPYKYQQNSQEEDKKTGKNEDTPIFTKIEDDLKTKESIESQAQKDDLNKLENNVENKTVEQDDIKAVDTDVSFELKNDKIFEEAEKSTNEIREKQNSQKPQVKTAIQTAEPKTVNIEKKSNDIRKKRVVKPDTKAINDLLSQNNLKTMRAVSANSYISYTKTNNKDTKNHTPNEIEIKNIENIQNIEKTENQTAPTINIEKNDRVSTDLSKENNRNININLSKSEKLLQKTDNLKENEKLEKTENLENTQKIDKIQKLENTQKIEKVSKIEDHENTQKIEKLDKFDNLSPKKVDIQKSENSIIKDQNTMNKESNLNLSDTQRFSGRFENLEQTQKVPLIKAIREKNQRINSEYGSNSYNSTNYNSFRNDNYNTSGVKSTIPSYPPKNNGKKNEQKAMYAGFWIRLLAFLIDYMLVAGITNIVSYFNPFELNPILESFLFVIILVIYNFISVYSTNGYTIGKLFTNIKVVSEKTDNIGFLTALTREVIGKFIIVKTFILPFFLVFSDKKHHLIDYLSDTSVIRQKYQDMYEELKAKGQL